MPGKLLFRKNEKEDDKKVSVTSILVIVFFLVAFIYVVILMVKNGFEKPVIYYKNNLEQYTTSEKILQSEYFYTIDLQVANFLEAVDKDMYNDLYNILISKYKKVYSKKSITDYLKNCKENIFKYDGRKVYTEHVKNVYSISSDEYLVQLDFDDGNFYIIIANGLKSYNFVIVE